MTEGKKKTLSRLGIILVVLTVAVLAMAGTGAAELKDISNVDNFTLTYIDGGISSVSYDATTGEYKYTLEGYYPVTKTLTNTQLKNRFGTDRIYTFETAEDINAIAERAKSSDDWKHNVTYIQVADIDCTGIEMKSIPGWVYNFNIYGNGHIITNYTQSGDDAHGLIQSTGQITGSVVTVDSVVMRNCMINNTNTGYVGAIVGRNEQNTLRLRGCKLENSTIKSYQEHYDTSGSMAGYVGGLVGGSEASLKTVAFIETFFEGLLDWKNLIKPFIKVISGDISDYYQATFLELSDCSVTQSKIMCYNDPDISSLFKYDKTFVGGLFGGASTSKSYVKIGFCNVSQSKIGSHGQYVGGVSGYGDNVIFDNLDTYVDNCIIETSYGSAGGLFGCACTISSNDKRSDRDLYLVKNTAVLSGDSYSGVVIGDVSVYYKASIPETTDNRVQAENVLVCGKNWGVFGLVKATHVVSPGYDNTEKDRIVDYVTRGVYYNPDTKRSDGAKIDGFTLYGEQYVNYLDNYSKYYKGDSAFVIYNKYHTQNNITQDFIGCEFSENRVDNVTRVMNGDIIVADIGVYGTEDGYGYFPSRPVTLTFTQTTEYYDGDELKTKVDRRTIGAYTNRSIKEPDPLFIEPEDYSEDEYTFSGWFVDDEELTNSWDFKNDKIQDSNPRNFYSKLTAKEKAYYDVEYHNGSDVITDSHLECAKPYVLKVLDDTDEKLFQGWNSNSDGTGIKYEVGDWIARYTTDTLILYAQWTDKPKYTVTFTPNNDNYGTVSQPSITGIIEGTAITVNSDNTITIGSYGEVSASPSSSNFKFDGWTYNSERVMGDMTITAKFSKINNDLLIMNDKIIFDTVEKGSELPAWDANAVVIQNNTDYDVTVGLDSVQDFNYKYCTGDDIENLIEGLPTVISHDTQMNILVQPKSERVATAGEYQDMITLTYNGTQVKILVSLSVIEPVEESENIVIPVSPEVYVVDYVLNNTATDYPMVMITDNSSLSVTIIPKETAGTDKDVVKATINPKDDTGNVSVRIDKFEDNNYNGSIVYLDANDEIYVEYPEIKTDNNGTCTLDMGVNTINGIVPAISSEYDESVAEAVKAYNKDYNIFGMITSLNTDTEIIDKNLKNVSMTFGFPGDRTIQKAENIKVLHVKGTEVSEVSDTVVFVEATNEWLINATSDKKFSSYVVVTTDPLTKNNPSTITAFIGEQDGNAFTYERAVVITKAVLPGATRSSVINTNGSGWYTCNIEADGFTGNGTVYFQVPLDVIEIKGYTVNDVSFIGETTTYLGSDDRYAKYTSTLGKAGAHTIDFEKGAAATGVVDTPVVTPAVNDCKITISGASSLKVGEKFNLSAACSCGKTHNYNWTVSDPAVATVTELGVLNGLKVGTVTVTVTDENGHSASKVVTVAAKETQTAAKSPFPVLGILAGLGIAGIVALRRK